MYGTTINGGANDAGTVFQLTPSGILSMLYSFSGGSDGAYPSGDLFADAGKGRDRRRGPYSESQPPIRRRFRERDCVLN